MAQMTANGLAMKTPEGDELVVNIGDRVLLRAGWTGVAHNWTEDGVAVHLDSASVLTRVLVFNVWAVYARDGDIARILGRP
jgi:hypothetical protein